MPLVLTLNGSLRRFASAPDTPLLWALRDELALTGTKFGCGAGLCGACSVLVDGAPTRSCITPIADVVGKTVTTIEGLDGEVARAVQDAWIAAQVPQCGYCQPGFVVATTGVIAADRTASRDAVLGQLTNICRCGTYDAIRVAVGDALARLNALAPPQQHGQLLPSKPAP